MDAGVDFGEAAGAAAGTALVAVGGYGRRELAPYSDLDVVLVHEEGVAVADVAKNVWYPLWDRGADVDHSVRALPELASAAARDVRVALGLLDARHLAGDASVTLRLRASLLAQWRRDARTRLPELRELVGKRAARTGELAHVAVPDLKDAIGGLRDSTVLKALVASWLVDVPHTDLERCRGELLDLRDVVHALNGRRSDRIGPELWDELAGCLGLEDALAAHRHVRGLGRRMAHLSRLTWRRLDAVLARPPSVRRRGPSLQRLGGGVAVSLGEVVLDGDADPTRQPLLLLRAAAEAAERDLTLSPPTAARLARECPALPEPWPLEARDLLTRFLASGQGLLQVWETAEETGGIERLFPEWDRVRLLPHASEMHRFTVDRHLVETCTAASALVRRVARPDLLMLAALLHDIGKGGGHDHSVAGEPIARSVAQRLGFAVREVDQVGTLVRWHLLLSEMATTRDIDDPATVAHVTDRVSDPETLDLLAALTEADARATASQAWTGWRSRLVEGLVSRVRQALGSEPAPATWRIEETTIPPAVRADPSRVEVRVESSPDGARVVVTSGDRVGVMAAVAATFAVQRVSVRTARAWVQGEVAVSVWDVDEPLLEPAVLLQRIESVLAGAFDPHHRLVRTAGGRLEPSVAVHPEASVQATVLEVRADDRPGTVYLVCAALADLELSVRSAHISTLGPQAVDVFYIQEIGAGALGDERSATAAHAVRQALSGTVTLDASPPRA